MTDADDALREKLTDLMRRTSICMDGEDLLDVVAVCADMVVFALYRQYTDDHKERTDALEELLVAMRRAMQRMSDERPAH